MSETVVSPSPRPAGAVGSAREWEPSAAAPEVRGGFDSADLGRILMADSLEEEARSITEVGMRRFGLTYGRRPRRRRCRLVACAPVMAWARSTGRDSR